MSVTTPIQTIPVGTTLTLQYPSDAPWEAVVVANVSPYALEVANGANQSWLAPGIENIFYLTGGHQPLQITAVEPSGVIPFGANANLIATWYGSGEKIPGGSWPVSIAPNAIGGSFVGSFPPGTIFAFGSTTAPNGFLLCDGSAVSQATYPNLFTAIGGAFGAAPAGEFRVPDLRDRAPVGAGDSYTVGQDVGAATGSDTASVTIGQANLPAYDLGVTNTLKYGPDTSEGDGQFAVSRNTTIAGYLTNTPGGQSIGLASFTGSIAESGEGDLTVASDGSGTALDVPITVPTVPPSLGVGFIIAY